MLLSAGRHGKHGGGVAKTRKRKHNEINVVLYFEVIRLFEN